MAPFRSSSELDEYYTFIRFKCFPLKTIRSIWIVGEFIVKLRSIIYSLKYLTKEKWNTGLHFSETNYKLSLLHILVFRNGTFLLRKKIFILYVQLHLYVTILYWWVPVTFFFAECWLWLAHSDNGAEQHIEVRYDVLEVPITLPFQKPPVDKPNPKQGISKLSLYMVSFV